MNPIFIDFGFIEIYWYSIMILLAIIVGSFIFYKSLRKKGFKEEEITDLLFWMIIFGIIGARIYYVLFNLNYFLKYPIEIIEVWNGGLAIHGGILGGLGYLCFYCHKKNYNLLKITDSAALGLLLSQAIGRWGNFFNSEAHGGITTLEHLKSLHIPNFIINGMKIDGVYYIPTFYYEFLWNILGFIIIIFIYKKYKKLRVGQITGIYFIWYSCGRFIIEQMRTDSLMFFNLKIAQIVSVILLIVGLILVFYHKKDTRVKRLKERGLENDL